MLPNIGDRVRDLGQPGSRGIVTAVTTDGTYVAWDSGVTLRHDPSTRALRVMHRSSQDLVKS